MNVTIEMTYRARNTMLLFKLGEKLGKQPGIKYIQASGGEQRTDTGVILVEGAILVEAATTKTVDKAIERVLPRIKKNCGAYELNYVVREDDGSINTEAYIPKRILDALQTGLVKKAPVDDDGITDLPLNSPTLNPSLAEWLQEIEYDYRVAYHAAENWYCLVFETMTGQFFAYINPVSTLDAADPQVTAEIVFAPTARSADEIKAQVDSLLLDADEDDVRAAIGHLEIWTMGDTPGPLSALFTVIPTEIVKFEVGLAAGAYADE
jgi:hypothetical protein